MIPAWVDKYVGLPFADHGRGPEYDCWGLVRHVLLEQFGLVLPDYGSTYSSTNDKMTLPDAFRNGLAEEWRKVQDPHEGDIIILNLAGRPMHCGILVGDGCMLHARPTTGSVVESYERLAWIRRVDGFYRNRTR